MRKLFMLCVFALAGCSTPFLVIQDSQIDSVKNELLNTNLTGIWTNDKKKSPNGTLAIYKTAENYVTQNLREGELDGVAEVTKYIRSKEIKNPYPSRLIKIEGNYFGVFQYPTKELADLPIQALELNSARGVALLTGINSDEVNIYYPDVDRLENLFPVNKPFYSPVMEIISKIFGLKNRFTVKYKWNFSRNEKYTEGPKLDKRMMLMVSEDGETLLAVAASNGVFAVKSNTWFRVSTLEQADRSAAALAAKAEQERMLAEKALQMRMVQLEIDEKVTIAQAYPSRIATALQCASQFGRVSDVSISAIQKGDDREWIVAGGYLISGYRGSFVAKAFSNPLKLKSINWTEITGTGYVSTSCF